MENKPKPRHKSKTYMFGIVLVAIGLVIFTLPGFSALVEILAADYQAVVPVVLVVIGGAILILRELTTGPVGSPPSDDD